ncbi:hypothetical protein RDV89_18410 [Nocardioides zeae]|uniref:DUF2631 domain-containing protein n=1 Tax=Nocardioides imazamoxiresistens TaxID=3231893 RepID=A0ABU3Q0N0_9ACTN|nr:hypothetical protein [Nocardioides zeae]MDT9595067.1 hypothetical protein [Nocardioides zeae]
MADRTEKKRSSWWFWAVLVGAFALNVVLDLVAGLSLVARWGIVLAVVVVAGLALTAYERRRAERG